MTSLFDWLADRWIPILVIALYGYLFVGALRQPASRVRRAQPVDDARRDSSVSLFEETNPATGLPLTGGAGSMDIGGNHYGECSHSSLHHDAFGHDSFSHSSANSFNSSSSFHQD